MRGRLTSCSEFLISISLSFFFSGGLVLICASSLEQASERTISLSRLFSSHRRRRFCLFLSSLRSPPPRNLPPRPSLGLQRRPPRAGQKAGEELKLRGLIENFWRHLEFLRRVNFPSVLPHLARPSDRASVRPNRSHPQIMSRISRRRFSFLPPSLPLGRRVYSSFRTTKWY